MFFFVWVVFVLCLRCFEDLGYDDFVGVVDGLFDECVRGGFGRVLRFSYKGCFVFFVLRDFCVDGVLAPVFFEEFGWGDVLGLLDGGVDRVLSGGCVGGVFDTFRFRGVFLSVGVFGFDECDDVLLCL